MEYWDLLNQKRQATGLTHRRGDPVPSSLYHVVVEIWTYNSKQEVLLTLRHPDKHYGLYWETTAGSIIAGETSRQGAVRELYEETGISAHEKDLVLLGTQREEHSFIDTYITKKDFDLSEVVLQEGETIDAKLVSLKQLNQIIKEELIAKPNVRRLARFRKQFDEIIMSGT